MSFPIVELGDVVKFIGGSQPPKSSFSYEEKTGYVRLLQIRDYKSDNNLTYIREDSTKKFCSKYDVMIGRYGPPVFQILRGLEGAYNVALMKAKPSEMIDRDFLYYFLKQKKLFNLIDGLSQRTAGQSGVDMNALKKYPMILFPLAEQQQLAAILDAADSLRQKDQQLVALYTALSQSLFLEMFGDPVTNPMGWDKLKLGNVCGVGSSKRVYVDDFVAEGIPFYRGTEVGQLANGKDITPHLFISQKHFLRLKEQSGVPKVGDLLLPSICHDGKIWLVSSETPFYFKDGRVLWIKVDKDKVSSEFIRFFLKSLFHANYASIASGTTFAELKIVALKGLIISSPPIELQNQFAERIQAIESQKQQAQTNLEKSEALFNSLLHRAFTGELTS